ncbi:NUDIX hydrolase [Shouchella shacheensis]|uniref:NUDIX hydrolase n=1 Tax=Shouchella shacheensis TaxID=1649580 RepID=UPI000740406C|nr:NUDIX domain-containing protein [Shouchella shacheensis]
MENEQLRTFTEDGREEGVNSRADVHRLGLWHETFHCWVVSIENRLPYLHLQLRSSGKKDFPNLFDITAAGHLLASETIADGVREVKEELGIDVSLDQLLPLGVLKNVIIQEELLDRELSNVFLYVKENEFEGYELQEEEVAGIVKVKFDDFCALCAGSEEEVTAEGFVVQEDGERKTVHRSLTLCDVVPHSRTYFEQVLRAIQEELEGQRVRK